jgi:hypothetical protein
MQLAYNEITLRLAAGRIFRRHDSAADSVGDHQGDRRSNYSEWVGNSVAVAIGQSYHFDDRNATAAARPESKLTIGQSVRY